MSQRHVPGVAALRTYHRAWLPKDVVAGLVLTALLVPQGMAYAELAGLPAITGLYTSIMCLLGYAVFGPSRILVLGPDSSLGPMIAATILPLVGADGDPAKAIALASMLSLLVAACMIGAGLGKLGFVADLFSKPTQIGYMNGLALTILVGQLPKLFGFSVDADSFIEELTGFLRGRGRRRDRAGRAAHRRRAAWRSSSCSAGWPPRSPACSSPSSRPSRRSCCSTSAARACRWWASCPRASRRSPCRTSSSVTCPCWWRARSASPWCRSPTPSPPRRRSPPAPARRSTPTRR